MRHVLAAILFVHDLKTVVSRTIPIYPGSQRLDPTLPHDDVEIQGIEGPR
jgi:hypothetical protein